MATSITSVHILDRFDHRSLSESAWGELLQQSDTNTVFQTRVWQETWWNAFGRGQLLLLLVERDGKAVTLAPMFCDGGMIFFVGSGGSDYLDFIGSNDTDVLKAVFETATERLPQALGFRFYHVPDSSRTGERLSQVAAEVGLVCFNEGSLAAPALDLRREVNGELPATQKKSLLRHEKFFRQSGQLELCKVESSQELSANLSPFFDQHVARWASTPFPSLFVENRQRAFYRALVARAADAPWLRFTRLDWNSRPIAYHFGFHYCGSYMWYKPSFDIEVARRSPGEVLLRQLLFAAVDEQAEVFDFGLGDEPFKQRFATRVNHVTTWGCYPASVST